ncbi:hypothetical protein C7S16_3093 [Burkholderia thailandensis]|uniref:Uncharacterized protein n=1 Tax=Burkholderia thailandensis TaxID=57975 RepID=A0AAW9D6Z7_BURTH|nr:hypothetical protein [Burkholderia thailandensis]
MRTALIVPSNGRAHRRRAVAPSGDNAASFNVHCDPFSS